LDHLGKPVSLRLGNVSPELWENVAETEEVFALNEHDRLFDEVALILFAGVTVLKQQPIVNLTESLPYGDEDVLVVVLDAF